MKDRGLHLLIVLLSVALGAFIMAGALLIWSMPVDKDRECGRILPPACAEMGTCTFNFDTCEYEDNGQATKTAD